MKLIIALLICSSLVIAQNQLTEFQNKIKNLPDTTRIDRLTEFCWNNRNKVPQLALKAGQEAAGIAESISDYKRQAEAFNKIGVVYRNLAYYDKALKMYNKALSISEKIKDSIQVAFSYNNLGGIYRLEGNHKEALRYILQAYGIFERANHKEGMSFCTINIGLIYRRQNSPQKALEYLNKTLKIREEIKDFAGKALALNLIAEVNFEIGNIDEALKHYLQVEKEYSALDDQKGLAATWIGLSQVWLSKKKITTALNYVTRANALAKKISYFEGEVFSLIRLGNIYAAMQQTEKAKQYFNEADRIASSKKEIQIKLESLKSQAEFYQKIQEYENALVFNKKYHTLRDSVLTYESSALLAQMERDISAERDEKRYNALLAEKDLIEKRRNYLIALSVMVLALAGVVYNRYRASKKYNKKLAELNSMKDKLFSIIAHDLKNPLHAIFGLTDHLISDYNTISDQERVSLLGKIDYSGKQILKLLENLLFWSSSQSGRIEFSPKMNDLHKIVEETISVVKGTANDKKIEILNDVKKESLVYCDSEMIKTIMRNLISNSIKFTDSGGNIRIGLAETEKSWQISVKDNGIGMDEEKRKSLFRIDSIKSSRGTDNEPGTGFGLLLCKDFVDKHKGSIEVESSLEMGTTINVLLPILYKNG